MRAEVSCVYGWGDAPRSDTRRRTPCSPWTATTQRTTSHFRPCTGRSRTALLVLGQGLISGPSNSRLRASSRLQPIRLRFDGLDLADGLRVLDDKADCGDSSSEWSTSAQPDPASIMTRWRCAPVDQGALKSPGHSHEVGVLVCLSLSDAVALPAPVLEPSGESLLQGHPGKRKPTSQRRFLPGHRWRISHDAGPCPVHQPATCWPVLTLVFGCPPIAGDGAKLWQERMNAARVH